jgi:succinate dehydrogenase / fumarate reductase, cytochrome b subunit
MDWLSRFFSSSIGRKVIMSLTGLFLITFLIVHLVGNLQLLKGDGGEAFNTYAYFMTHNPLIKTVSYGLYFFILLHAFIGLQLWWNNRTAKGSTYAVSAATPNINWAARNMALLGTIILIFIIVHMAGFWAGMKFGDMPEVSYTDYPHKVKDLYTSVAVAFKKPLYVIFYVLSMGVLGFHLAHGFQSAFQTMGWSHPKYTPIIKGMGLAYAVLVSIGFAAIPLIFFLAR